MCTDRKALWGKFVNCDIGQYKINWIELNWTFFIAFIKSSLCNDTCILMKQRFYCRIYCSQFNSACNNFLLNLDFCELLFTSITQNNWLALFKCSKKDYRRLLDPIWPHDPMTPDPKCPACYIAVVWVWSAPLATNSSNKNAPNHSYSTFKDTIVFVAQSGVWWEA